MKKRFVLTLDQLRRAMPALSLTKATELLPHLQAAMDEYDINTRMRVCAFLSIELAHESNDLTRWRESFNYKPSRLHDVFRKYFKTVEHARQALMRGPDYIAETVYGGRKELGNIQPGDGAKYIGRGPTQTTGRANYELAQKVTGEPLLAHPELLEQRPDIGLRVAAHFWSVEKRCNEFADELRGIEDKREFDLIVTITKRINGGKNGLEDRVIRYRRALAAIKGDARPWPEERAPEPHEVEEWLSDDKGSSVPAQQSTPAASGDAKTQTNAVLAPDAQETSGNAQTGAEPSPFDKLLRNDAIKTSAKTNSVRGVKLLWRPLATLITAIQAGNIFAISGTVLAVLVVVVLVVLYHKEIRSGLSSLTHFIVDKFTK